MPNKHSMCRCNACKKKTKKNCCWQTHRSFGRCLCLLTGNCLQARSSRTMSGWWRDWSERACRLRRSRRPDSRAAAGTYNCPDDMILKAHTSGWDKVYSVQDVSTVLISFYWRVFVVELCLYRHSVAHSNQDTNFLKLSDACMFRSVNFVGDRSGPAPYLSLSCYCPHTFFNTSLKSLFALWYLTLTENNEASGFPKPAV